MYSFRHLVEVDPLGQAGLVVTVTTLRQLAQELAFVLATVAHVAVLFDLFQLVHVGSHHVAEPVIVGCEELEGLLQTFVETLLLEVTGVLPSSFDLLTQLLAFTLSIPLATAMN